MQEQVFRQSFEDFTRVAERKFDDHLPPLDPMFEHPSEWQKRIADFFSSINQQITKFFEWLNKIFSFEGGSGKAIDLALLFKIAAAFLILALLVALAVAIVSRARGRSEDRGRYDFLPPQKRQQMLLLVEQCESAKNWAEAARILWKIFLLERNLPDSWTPRVYRRENRNLSANEESLAYEMMFSGRSTESLYRQFKSRFAEGAIA